MTNQIASEIYRHTNLTNESEEYLLARETLRLAEIDLMRSREAVAALRRKLLSGPALEDYEFLEGPTDLQIDEPVHSVKLSELFSEDHRSLVIYQLMYGKKQVKPCPMCTLWTDSANGVAQHLAQNINFAIVAAADLSSLREHGRARGWNHLRLLSAGESHFKYDLRSEDAEGQQDSAVSVFEKDGDGTVRHVYTTHPRMGPDVKERGIDLLVPLWHYLDLTPQGRGDWYPALEYETR